MQSIPSKQERRPPIRTLANQSRTIFSQKARPDAYLPGSSTIYGQFWMGQSLWRPSALWAAIAGMLACGLLSRADAPNWQGLALLCLLVDMLWGGIWRLSGGRDQLLPLRSQPGAVQVRLPYLQPNSPAAQLFQWNTSDVWPWLLRVALPTVVVSLLVAFTMGQVALLLTVTVALITVAGWITRRNFNQPPAIWQALVTIALPWYLTLWQQGIALDNGLWSIHLWLIALWTIHHWGEGRLLCLEADWAGIALLAIADLGLLGLMVTQRLPLWLALLALLMLPTWYAIAHRRSVDGVAFWWWLSILASAIAISQV